MSFDRGVFDIQRRVQTGNDQSPTRTSAAAWSDGDDDVLTADSK